MFKRFNIVRRLLTGILLAMAGLALIHTNPNAKIRRGERVVTSAKTANYTITAEESGTIFTTEGAAGEVVFTLPAAADGLHYMIYCAEAQNVVLVSDTADTLIVFNDVAADQIAFNTSNEIVGGAFRVFSDGAKWMVAEMIHDAQTSVIAT